MRNRLNLPQSYSVKKLQTNISLYKLRKLVQDTELTSFVVSKHENHTVQKKFLMWRIPDLDKYLDL